MKTFIKEYKERNLSYTPKCIFNVGHSSGFFSELNHMIFSMVYCDKEKIQFNLFSDNANFSNQSGWEEFFLPFCPENHNELNRYNYRYLQKSSTIGGELQRLKRLVRGIVVKWLCGASYFTYDVLMFGNLRGFISKEELVDLARPYAEMVWRFNPQTAQEVGACITSLNLPTNYVALHVRRGDKLSVENLKTTNFVDYINSIEKNSEEKNIFIFCDDYRDFELLQKKYPCYKFFTLCSLDEKGYFHKSFSSVHWEVKRSQLIKLFANIEILKHADFTVGTNIANPSLFLKMIMPSSKFIFVEEKEPDVYGKLL